MPKTMLLFDAFAVIHRAYHALPDFTAPDGSHVNAVYGFLSTFIKAVRETKPSYVVVAFDLPGPTMRHQVFEAYKATRPETPANLADQVPLVKELVEAMGLPVLLAEGYEAEDVIATVIEKTKQEDLEYVIVTGDMDTLQLASQRVKIYFLRRGLADITLVDDKGVEATYGVTPKEFIDVKALKGDPSDNIPGVAGIGTKTAVDLVKQFGSLEKMYADLSRVPDRYRRLLQDKREQAMATKDLVTIKNDAPVEISLDTLRWSEESLPRVVPILEQYHMKTLIKRITEPPKELGGASTATKAKKPSHPGVEQASLL